MKNNMIGVLVLAVVYIIVVGGVLVPSIQNMTKTHDTFDNDCVYYMTEFDENTSIVYTFDGTNWTANGEALDAPYATTTIVAGDGVILRANGIFYTSNHFPTKSITSLTVTASGMTGTVVNSNNVTQSVAFNRTTYYAATTEETQFCLVPYNSTTYVNGDSEIFADGWTVIGNVGAVFEIDGSINDGFTVTCAKTQMIISNVTCNYTEVDGYLDLYLISSITFDVTNNAGTEDESDDVSGVATYTSYIAPATITAEKSSHMSAVEISLFNIFPVLVVLIIVCGFAFAVMRNRDY